MDEKIRRRMQLDCLYDMFRDRIEENVIYIVHSENDGQLDTTIDQLMSISSCSFTGHHFEQMPKPLVNTFNSINSNNIATKSNLNNANILHDNVIKTTSNSQKLIEDSNKQNEKDADVDKLEDDGNIGTVDERIERLRKSIDDLLSEKKISHDKASKYMSKKMFPVTSYYTEMGCQLKRMIDRKTSQLVDLLLQKSQESNCIDLHGLNPIQASQVVSELLEVIQEKLVIDKQGEVSIDIITGWGKHSVSQVGHRVRPTIISLLREKGYRYHYLNKGALRVTIRRR